MLQHLTDFVALSLASWNAGFNFWNPRDLMAYVEAHAIAGGSK